MIRTRPSFHSLLFGYLPQRANIKLIKPVVKKSRPFTENVEKTLLAFPSRWRIIDNTNNFYCACGFIGKSAVIKNVIELLQVLTANRVSTS